MSIYKGKKLYQKRLELLNIFDNVKVSKNGNYYVVLYKQSEYVEHSYSCYNVTKSTIDKLGESYGYFKDHKTILLLTEKGFLFKKASQKRFQKLNLKILQHFSDKIVEEKLARLALFNTKAEWLWQYPNYFAHYKFVRSFRSPKELKSFLKFNFLSVKDFYEKVNLNTAIDGFHLVEDKSSLVGVPYGKNLKDTFTMLRTLNRTLKRLPKNIEKLHNSIAREIKSKDFSYKNYDFQIYNSIESKLEGLDFRILKSQMDLYDESVLMSHCVGKATTYYDRLKKGSHVYIHFVYNDSLFTAEIDDRFVIRQIQGKYNSSKGVEELKNELFNRGFLKASCNFIEI